ncbi:MAG: FKBP-type peptidyl-prolyl cis-trans isomerase N-terminal domain-containing protein, partial [Prevotella sp.]|nr:FKBP-type peptidyl-prolyl cis-trans isomerase N-terminal domain-containing protein [Prevotella sp.]
MDKISYALGLSIGNNFLSSGIKNVDFEAFLKGMKDVINGTTPAMSYEEAKEVMNDYFSKLQDERLEVNQKAGEEFLAINKNKPGVVTLPSGLQYEILKKGDGPIPVLTDQV